MLILIFGLAGVLSTVFIYQQKSRIGLLVAKLISDVIWFMYYFLQAAYSGAAVAVIGIIRELIFINKEIKQFTHAICTCYLQLQFAPANGQKKTAGWWGGRRSRKGKPM